MEYPLLGTVGKSWHIHCNLNTIMDTREIELAYSNINARMAGMKGMLLNEKDYELILSRDSVSSVITFLNTTSYSKDIRRIKGGNGSGSNTGMIKEGLNRNLHSVFKRINMTAVGESRILLSTLIGWWDIYNIKTVLRGRQNGRSEEEIKYLLVATGTLCNRRLVGLLQETDLKNLITSLGYLGFPCSLPAAERLIETYLAGGSILLEGQIEKAYFEDVLKKVNWEGNSSHLAIKIIRSQIDKANIITGLKITNKDGLDPEAYFIDGGEHISIRLHRELFKDKKKLAEKLPHIIRMGKWCLKEEDLRTPERISVLERRIEMGMLKDLFQTSLIDTYSMGVIVSYIWRKVNEVINLNTILHGRLNGIPNETIRELLVVI